MRHTVHIGSYPRLVYARAEPLYVHRDNSNGPRLFHLCQVRGTDRPRRDLCFLDEEGSKI